MLQCWAKYFFVPCLFKFLLQLIKQTFISQMLKKTLVSTLNWLYLDNLFSLHLIVMSTRTKEKIVFNSTHKHSEWEKVCKAAEALAIIQTPPPPQLVTFIIHTQRPSLESRPQPPKWVWPRAGDRFPGSFVAMT